MMTWGNGLIRLVDFLNFSFRIALCDGGCSPYGLAILRSFKINFSFRIPYFSPCGLAI